MFNQFSHAHRLLFNTEADKPVSIPGMSGLDISGEFFPADIGIDDSVGEKIRFFRRISG
jgi:hypothetical protein